MGVDEMITSNIWMGEQPNWFVCEKHWVEISDCS